MSRAVLHQVHHQVHHQAHPAHQVVQVLLVRQVPRRVRVAQAAAVPQVALQVPRAVVLAVREGIVYRLKFVRIMKIAAAMMCVVKDIVVRNARRKRTVRMKGNAV